MHVAFQRTVHGWDNLIQGRSSAGEDVLMEHSTALQLIIQVCKLIQIILVIWSLTIRKRN